MNLKNIFTFNIKLSSKDKIKRLRLPTEMSQDLAYISGVLAGDGNIFVRKNKYDYRIKCVGNPKNEKEFYDNVLKPLFNKVFGIHLDVKKQDSGVTYGFYIYSKALVEYFTKTFELPIGRKTDKLKIPEIIINTHNILPFLRGVADTDFSISFKKNGTYPCIVGSSDSRDFMQQIAHELKNIGFRIYEAYDYKIIDSRLKKGYSIINRIEISGRKNLNLWIQKIGFSSPKHLRKIIKKKPIT